LKHILLSFIALLLLVGCKPEKNPIQVNSTVAPLKTVATLETTKPPEPTNLPKPTVVPVPSATKTPIPTPGYCDYDQAMAIVNRLDELTASSGNHKEGEITDEQMQEILKAFDERIIELDQMDAPECLEKSVDLLKTSFIHLREMFSGETDDIFKLFTTISEDQAAFDVEFALVKTCIPAGCQ
jgi:hypothetical protein